MYVHRQLVKLAIVKANVEQSNVDVEKLFCFCSTKCHSKPGACKNMRE